MVIGYWLLVIGYWLLVIGYWLLVIGYWLLVIGCTNGTFQYSIHPLLPSPLLQISFHPLPVIITQITDPAPTGLLALAAQTHSKDHI